jgi:hypothetical protein
MSELLNNSTFIIWTGIVLICVVPTITHAWYKVRRAELDASLKLEMIQHNMSADDIIRILQASAREPGTNSRRIAERPRALPTEAQA